MKVVYTGANGQLGRALGKVWPEAIGLDREALDLTWPDYAIRERIMQYEPDVVINCAAYTRVDLAEVEPFDALQINGTAVAPIADACNKLDALLIQISTDYVHPRAESIYAESKLWGERAAETSRRYCIIRTSWVFGDGSNFVRTMAGLADRPSLEVVDNEVGRPTYAEDLAAAIKHIVVRDEDPYGLLCIQNDGDVISWAGLAKQIFAELGSRTKVVPILASEWGRRVKEQGKPYAKRPLTSTFDLGWLEEYGIAMPDWRLAVRRYLATLDTPASL